MVGNTKGVGDSGQIQPLTPAPASLGPTEGEVAMSTPVRTLNDMKQVLTDHLGEEQGTKMYNFFIASILSGAFTTIQGTSQKAAQSVKKMSQNE